jgi:hypothetical protein
MRHSLFAIAIGIGLFAASCATSPSENVELKIQDPCSSQCTSFFNRCVEDSGGDSSRCNEDRADCEQECRADSAEKTGGDGVITPE